MEIADLSPNDEGSIAQIAAFVVDAFRDNHPNAWPDLESATEEVRESLQPNRISRIARDDQGDVIGWGGAIRQYRGYTWELHPCVVRPDVQEQGIGRQLVADLEEQVAARGGTTLWLGTDDENAQTTVANVDLYPDVLGNLGAIRNNERHPYEFYLKVGFSLVGLLPDANGPGQPDIIMAKRVVPWRQPVAASGAA